MNRCFGISHKVRATCLESWRHGEESSEGDPRFVSGWINRNALVPFHMSMFLEATKRIQVVSIEEEKRIWFQVLQQLEILITSFEYATHRTLINATHLFLMMLVYHTTLRRHCIVHCESALHLCYVSCVLGLGIIWSLSRPQASRHHLFFFHF